MEAAAFPYLRVEAQACRGLVDVAAGRLGQANNSGKHFGSRGRFDNVGAVYFDAFFSHGEAFSHGPLRTAELRHGDIRSVGVKVSWETWWADVLPG